MPAFVIRNRMICFYIGCALVFLALALYGYYAINNGYLMRPAHMRTQNFATDMTYYDLPRMTVQVGRGSDEAHVRLDISLEIPKEDVLVMEGWQPRIADRLADFLITVRPDQFLRASSLPWLRGEMLRTVNNSGAPFPVHDLYFRQMLIM